MRKLLIEFYTRCKEQPWWGLVIAQCFGVRYDPEQRSRAQNARAAQIKPCTYARGEGECQLEPFQSALLMGAVKDRATDTTSAAAAGTQDHNTTDRPRSVEALVREIAGQQAPDVPILNGAEFDGETGGQQPSPGILLTRSWERGGKA